MSGTSVVIATNDSATCAGIRMALVSAGFEISAEVESVEAVIEAVEAGKPDACLVDVDLHGDVLAALGQLAGLSPATVIVVLTEDENDAQFLEAMRLGASGYLSKSIAPAALVGSVRAVLNGEPAVPRGLVAVLLNEYRSRFARRYLAQRGTGEAELTSREWEVLGCLSEGLSTRQIAERLLIAEVTVRRHIGAIVKKLDAENRADALKLLRSA